MARKRVDKLAQIAAWLEEASTDYVQRHGGYADKIGVVGEHVIIATTNEDGAPHFDSYDREACERWYADIQAYRKENGECELWEAVMETMP